MYINLDGLEIMVRARQKELIDEAAIHSISKRPSGFRWTRRALIRMGGMLVTTGIALERLGLGREIYHLSTTATR